MELLKAKEIDNNKIGNLLNILFYGSKGKTWSYIKNLIYNNKISKEAFFNSYYLFYPHCQIHCKFPVNIFRELE